MPVNSQPLEQQDMQGLLIRAYGYLPEATYLLLTFSTIPEARNWLKAIHDRITPAFPKAEHEAVQLGFTNTGLFKLLPPEKLAEQFSREFTEGMVTPERSRILGDMDTNASVNWQWGGADTPVDGILMLFASDKSRLETLSQEMYARFTAFGISEVRRLTTERLPDDKEHFGFRDGVSQPLMAGLEKREQNGRSGPDTSPEAGANVIQPGEFILGYTNEYGKIPFSPNVKPAAATGERFDIGRNGSYMVFRQLKQDVKAFWQFMEKTVHENPQFAGKNSTYLASKMVGRWPNGNPLVLTDDPHAPPVPDEQLNTFLYKKDDAGGLKCPIGAHIRKTNPRDGIDSDPATSVAVAKRHRILRRGRSFGEPLAMSMQPADILASPKDHDCGLYFICLNTNIGRQFEFIQHAWSNNSKFDGLYDDVDPLTGFSFLKYNDDKYVPAQFTIQDRPVRRHISDIPQFVYVQGGAYFFLPGIKALQVIARADSDLTDAV